MEFTLHVEVIKDPPVWFVLNLSVRTILGTMYLIH